MILLLHLNVLIFKLQDEHYKIIEVRLSSCHTQLSLCVKECKIQNKGLIIFNGNFLLTFSVVPF